MHVFFSPFIVPLGAFLVGIVAIVSGTVGKAFAERNRAQQRVALLAQGVPLQEVERILGTPTSEDRQAQPRSPWNPTRSAAMMRRTGLILSASGLGIVAFFVVLAPIVHDREVYAGAAVGLIPVFIGIGFLVDYRMQIRDITRYREEVGAPASAGLGK
jgi:hypothetical protein